MVQFFAGLAITAGLFVISWTASATSTPAENLRLCELKIPFKIESYQSERAYCDSIGRLRRLEILFKKNNNPSQIWDFDEQFHITQNRIFNIDGMQTGSIDYEHVDGDQYYIKTLTQDKESKKEYLQTKVLAKVILKDGAFETTHLKTWFYTFENSVHRLDHADTFSPARPFPLSSIVSRRDFFGPDGQLEESYLFTYHPKTQKQTLEDYVSQFDVLDGQGRLIGHYDEMASLDIESWIHRGAQSALELQERLSIYRDTSREPVVVIDTGFDYTHPYLAHYMHNDPVEILDGIDNDNDGWVDNIFGWNHDPLRTDKTSIITEKIYLNFASKMAKPVPFSHGTHVSLLALQGTSRYGLVGFAGDWSQVSYLRKISHWIKERNIRFSNMSFGFGNQRDPMSASPDAQYAIFELIRDNSQTLFFIAAGNTQDRDNDLPENEDFPATVPFENTFVVSAANVGELDYDNLDKIGLAHFSSFGKVMVDAVAPGDYVNSANLGGGFLKVSGTSMASPWAMNVALRVNEVVKLSIEETKELLMKTVYIANLEHALPVRSGGIIMPERALLAAQIYRDGNASIEEACLMAHEKIQYKNERMGGRQSLEDLKAFWRERKI